MTAGKAKAAAAVGPLKGPRHVLLIARRHAFAHVLVAAVRAVTAPHRFLRRHVREDGRHALHAGRKAHVKIPLVVGLERLHAAGDGVFGQLFEIRHPMRVHGPMGLKAAALPRDEFLVALVGGGLHGVVDGEETDALLHHAAEHFEVVATQRRVPSAAVAVDYHRSHIAKNVVVLWPTVEHHGGCHKVAGIFLQTLGQQHDARLVFVRQRPVALPAGDHHHLLWLGHRAKREGESEGEEEEFFHGKFIDPNSSLILLP